MCICSVVMYEGKNIHFSAIDNKPLCSFSSKCCNQRRLNGYAFCVRHILEDPTAPFKRCAYVAKSSGQTCTQAIPKNETREYCNNHMQVLGLLPRKERKQKGEKECLVNIKGEKEVLSNIKGEKEGPASVKGEKDVLPSICSLTENRISFEDRVKNKFRVASHRPTPSGDNDDPEDPYAFPDPVQNGPSTPQNTAVVTSASSPLRADIPPSSCSVNNSTTKSQCGDCVSSWSGGSSIAKMFPELAEKLEKPRIKIEAKMKGKVKSSRTMNRLQTKIAQNRIKDKMKRSQDSTTPSCNSLSFSLDATPLSEDTKSTSSPDSVCLPSKSNVTPRSSFCVNGVNNSERIRHSDVKKVISNANVFPGLTQSVKNLHHPAPQLLPEYPPPPPYPGLDNRVTIAHRISASPLFTSVPLQNHDMLPTSQSSTFTSNRLLDSGVTHVPPPPPYTAPKSAVSFAKKSVLTSSRSRSSIEAESKKKIRPERSKLSDKCFVQRPASQHCMYSAGLLSSDESDSNDERISWQHDWFVASSDEEMNEEEDPTGLLCLQLRTSKLALLKARLRRQSAQSRKSYRSNSCCDKGDSHTAISFIQAIKDRSPAAQSLCQSTSTDQKKTERNKVTHCFMKRRCCHKTDEDVRCISKVLPCTNHCLKHIMYNVDQQLFDYCTAKFSDNTQCCVPVFDVRHELPLCQEHGAKADNYSRTAGEDKPKRPRKKTKPSALTRPFKRGKKKKSSRRHLRPQKSVPPTRPDSEVESCLTASDTSIQPDVCSIQPDVCSIQTDVCSIQTDVCKLTMKEEQTPVIKNLTPVNDLNKNLEPDLSSTAEIVAAQLTTGQIDVLPLEQASRLLEDHDFQDVFNKIPDETFDIFTGKSAEFVTNEEADLLEHALNVASRDIKDQYDYINKQKNYEISDDDIKQIAETLQNLQGSNIELNSESINAIAQSLAASALPTNMDRILPTTSLHSSVTDTEEIKLRNVCSVPNSLANSVILETIQSKSPFVSTDTSLLCSSSYANTCRSGLTCVSNSVSPSFIRQSLPHRQLQSDGQSLHHHRHHHQIQSDILAKEQRTISYNLPGTSGVFNQTSGTQLRTFLPTTSCLNSSYQNGFPMDQELRIQGSQLSGTKLLSHSTNHGCSESRSNTPVQLPVQTMTPVTILSGSTQAIVSGQRLSTLPPYTASSNGS